MYALTIPHMPYCPNYMADKPYVLNLTIHFHSNCCFKLRIKHNHELVNMRPRDKICLFVSNMEIYTRNFQDLSTMAERFERECRNFESAHPSTFIDPGNIPFEPDSDDYQLRIICLGYAGYVYLVYDYESQALLLDAIFISPQYRGMGKSKELLTYIVDFLASQSIVIDSVEAFTTSDGGDACLKILKDLLANRL